MFSNHQIIWLFYVPSTFEGDGETIILYISNELRFTCSPILTRDSQLQEDADSIFPAAKLTLLIGNESYYIMDIPDFQLVCDRVPPSRYPLREPAARKQLARLCDAIWKEYLGFKVKF